METATRVDYDVVTAGVGPCGLTLANHLGTLGVRTLVVGKLPALIGHPRGVGLDDDALRSFQAVGLVEAIRRHTVSQLALDPVPRNVVQLPSPVDSATASARTPLAHGHFLDSAAVASIGADFARAIRALA